MRKKVALLLALCMTAGTIGSPAGIQEIRAAEVQEMETISETRETGGEDVVILETAVKSAEDDLQSGDFKYGILEDGTVEIRGYLGLDTSITIPDTIEGKKVMGIGDSAFYNYKRPSSIVIPEGVTSIGDDAFSHCSSLSAITIPDSVTSIGSSAFSSCGSLESIIIPKKLTSIGNSVFSDCSSLNSIIIPEGVTSIGSRAFSSCDSLENIIIPEGVTSIENSVFYHCSSLNSIIIPEGVTSIGSKAFSSCDSLESIIIPEGVTNIGNGAFECCSSLSRVRIPGSVTEIGSTVFAKCSKLVDIFYTGTEEAWKKLGITSQLGSDVRFHFNSSLSPEYTTEEGFRYYIFDHNKIEIIGYTGIQEEIIIPDRIDANKVVSIGDSAFNCCGSLSSINIPEGVTSIGNSAFNCCGSLKSINIPEGVTSIGSRAFSSCDSLESINIPEGVTSIGISAFSECSSLSSITIPESVTSIGDWAFDSVSSLTVYCIKGSYAQEYATQNGFNVVNYSSGKKVQTITASDITKTLGDAPFFLDAETDGDSSLQYTSGNPSVVTVTSSGRVELLSVGTAKITIIAPVTDAYFRGRKEILITVLANPDDSEKPDNSEKPENTQKPEDTERPDGKQVITASDLVKTVGDPAFSLGVETNGDGILSFYSHQPDVVTVNDSGIAEVISAGTAQITVQASATELWEAAETTITVTVIPEDFTPVYDIADLYAIRNNPEGNYILVNDIDMSAATSKGGDYDCGTGWDSIETFSGTLDGNGHKIIGMHIFGEVSGNAIDLGLFESVSGSVKNLGMFDCKIEIDSIDVSYSLSIGMLVGKMGFNASIRNCYSSGIIRVNNHEKSEEDVCVYIGGLIGIVGYDTYSAYIENCYNLCEIQSNVGGAQIGGITGYYAPDGFRGSVLNCYNCGIINAEESSSVGSICGYFDRGEIDHCCYLKGTADQGIGGQQDDSKCVSLTEAQMRNPKLFTGFDFTDTWETDPYCSYPYPQLKNNQMVRVDSIRFASAPHKLIYGQGDAINVSGGILEIVYEDGIKTSIPLATEMLSGYDMAQLGKQTVWVHYGNAYISFEIEVKEVAVSSVTLPESLSLYRGKEQRLDAVVLPANASNPSLTWNSDNPAVAAVDGNGLVKAKAGGTATITATSVNGIQAKCVVSVIVPCISITLSSSSLILKEGTSAVLTAQILPLESNDTVQWASSNEEVAEVYDGTVVAKKAGTAVITASTGSGIKESCKVTVRKAGATTPGIQTITAKDIKKTYGVKPFALGAKASGGGKLTYSVENKKVARIDKNGKVTITGCGVTEIEIHAAANGEYHEAEKTITLTVVPKKLTVSSVKSQKSKSVTVKWKKDAKASGYIIEYSTDKKFRKGVKTAIVSKNKTTSKKITKLKAGKNYYVRACAYTLSDDDERIKGAYSKTKTVKVKK